MIDETTAKWIRDKSDQRAAERGCRFVQEWADNVCRFFEEGLVLYEGEQAGKPFALMDWQREVLSRIFGWARYSEFHKRWIRRFRRASLWVPKKNGKSPLAAGVGLYLFCADGEKGQKVFSAARDGKQANIMHTHAKKMVQQSPVLSLECRVNNQTGAITHDATSSVYALLAGDNIKGQEGLNGSVIIDETHVVDDRLARVIEYAGASRAEPLQFEVSTAGNDLQGYGRRQYEYGQAVRDGMVEDDQFFFQCYEAPQDAPDDVLLSPETWKKANPSWGTTINLEEIETAAKKAHRSSVDWAAFKMYRLNIWMNAADPWIRSHQWEACKQSFTEDDLAGRAAFIGLDLGRTQDTSSAVFVFPEVDESFWMLPFIWMPEPRVRMMCEMVPQMADWVKRGFIRVTPDACVDYTVIKRDIREIAAKFSVRSLVYDETYANELTQALAEGDDGGEPIGCDRHPFKQSGINFANPTEHFERLVISGKIRHNGNPMFTWQVLNTRAKTDVNGNYRPIKQAKGDYRTIDSAVAAIMGLAAASQRDTTSVYESSGSLSL